jgi:hypothetical protein
MTTLKSFQAEIERISHDKQKEAIQAAREAHAAAELAKHHGKVAKKEIIEVEKVEEEEADVSLEVRINVCRHCSL